MILNNVVLSPSHKKKSFDIPMCRNPLERIWSVNELVCCFICGVCLLHRDVGSGEAREGVFWPLPYFLPPTFSHLFCNFISENQGLEKSRSVSKLQNFRSCTPEFLFSRTEFLSVCQLDFFQVYSITLAFFWWRPK